MFTKERKLEMIEKVYTHFITEEKEFGYDLVNGGCIYGSAGDSNRCAIGIFDTKNNLKGCYGSVDRISLGTLKKIFPDVEDLSFLMELQIAHDSSAYNSNRKLFAECLERLKQNVLNEVV